MGDVLGYARISTGDQDVAGQAMRLEQVGAVRVFTDVRSSRAMDRPGLAALLDYARRGDTLAVVRLDRPGRALAKLLATMAMLKERSIALVSLEERIDTDSAAGELVFHLFGAIAHFERRLIAERTRDGIAAARASGKRPGTSAARSGKGHGGAQAGGRRPVADHGGATARSRTIHRLPGSRPGGHPTRRVASQPVAITSCSTFALSV